MSKKNKAGVYRYRLREGYMKTVERDKSKAFCKAKLLMKKFPYENYTVIFKKAANRYGIYDCAYARQECEEASIAAYMYSIYRCAAEGYEHVDRYIKKMIWIFTLWAVTAAADDMKRASWNEDFERASFSDNFDF